MRISEQGLEDLRVEEGEKLEAYLDGGGVPTIGVGHTGGVSLGDLATQEQVLDWLREDVAEAEAQVTKYVKVPLSQNQFDALVSLVFNIGPRQFRTSTLVRYLNNGDYEAAADQFLVWKMDNGKVVQGLLNRRERERDKFLA